MEEGVGRIRDCGNQKLGRRLNQPGAGPWECIPHGIAQGSRVVGGVAEQGGFSNGQLMAAAVKSPVMMILHVVTHVLVLRSQGTYTHTHTQTPKGGKTGEKEAAMPSPGSNGPLANIYR